MRGYLPGRFSFNVKGGRCEACAGDGTIKIEMHFLPDVYVPCEVCKGARYNRDTLDITFKGKNIAEVLDLSIEEALEFFANQPTIARHLQTLVDVGLGYVRLGQPAPTLSGGEAQRVKLSAELGQALHRAHALHPRRADHRPPLRGRAPAARRAAAARRRGQHGARDRAQPRRHQVGRLDRRPRSRGWRRRRAGDRRGHRPSTWRRPRRATPGGSSRPSSASTDARSMTDPSLWERGARWWQDEFTDGADPEYEEQILPLVDRHLPGSARVLDVGLRRRSGGAAGHRRWASTPVGVDPTGHQIAEARRTRRRRARTPRARPTRCRSPTPRSTPSSCASSSSTSIPSNRRSRRWRGCWPRVGVSSSC